MPKLYFAVFHGAAEVAMGDPIYENSVEIGPASAASNAIPNHSPSSGRHRYRVRAYPEADCFCHWGKPDPGDPEAKADGTQGRPMGAGVTEYFDIEAGYKIATIERTVT